MKAVDAADIRSSFVNASQGETERLPLPGLHEVMWDHREYLGWRDPQAHQRGYVVFWKDDRPVGIVLREADSALRSGIPAMCSLCRITQPSDQVSLFSAPRAGQAGRDGNTIGTYICSDLACSHLIRILPPASDMQPSPAEVLEGRIAGLLSRIDAFSSDVMRSA
ncbi:hypothetical protein M2152_001501 [Microbacteriaceae bacterium SG_E_30_P1]|uniref:Elongation factor G-binding protein C-terminal treble-clef zinc-finger domain-containing protein n=1 Tax=Antiquaquibacter oligotrophicus TaxID=2880260 RepID=A0ABT6KMT8_9MICO|nr:FBP domain-containing protein [Antiquaquibacter oligotrophicus]MDH6181319.1 hypothetical protein [Antiquaquibacter oligotrophicus]UDF12988.1 FBP domain-containing protein [Antiquaquibacter oligotrophicus]